MSTKKVQGLIEKHLGHYGVVVEGRQKRIEKVRFDSLKEGAIFFFTESDAFFDVCRNQKISAGIISFGLYCPIPKDGFPYRMDFDQKVFVRIG